MRKILNADDRELNQWVSLRKAVRHRTAEEERRDRKKYRQRARDQVWDSDPAGVFFFSTTHLQIYSNFVLDFNLL